MGGSRVDGGREEIVFRRNSRYFTGILPVYYAIIQGWLLTCIGNFVRYF